jgi:DNA-binding MurR/RpiR family transcriptional regulator
MSSKSMGNPTEQAKILYLYFQTCHIAASYLFYSFGHHGLPFFHPSPINLMEAALATTAYGHVWFRFSETRFSEK